MARAGRELGRDIGQGVRQLELQDPHRLELRRGHSRPACPIPTVPVHRCDTSKVPRCVAPIVSTMGSGNSANLVSVALHGPYNVMEKGLVPEANSPRLGSTMR